MLYFLNQLKRAGFHKTSFFISTLHLFAQFWNMLPQFGITWLTAHRLSSWNLPTNGLSILYNFYNITRGMSYPNVLFVADLESLETRRNNLSRSVFRDVCKPTSSLCHLIPPQRDTSVTSRLRHTTPLPKPSLRTKKYCFSINFITINCYTQSYCLFCLIVVFLFVITCMCIRYPALQPQCCQ